MGGTWAGQERYKVESIENKKNKMMLIVRQYSDRRTGIRIWRARWIDGRYEESMEGFGARVGERCRCETMLDLDDTEESATNSEIETEPQRT